MPYIKKENRPLFDSGLSVIFDGLKNPGDLNYCISRLCNEFMNLHGENYTNYNACIGALECAKLELYRMHIAPYENQKIKENGDIINHDVPTLEEYFKEKLKI